MVPWEPEGGCSAGRASRPEGPGPRPPSGFSGGLVVSPRLPGGCGPGLQAPLSHSWEELNVSKLLILCLMELEARVGGPGRSLGAGSGFESGP